jgi:hypothetical protein
VNHSSSHDQNLQGRLPVTQGAGKGEALSTEAVFVPDPQALGTGPKATQEEDPGLPWNVALSLKPAEPLCDELGKRLSSWFLPVPGVGKTAIMPWRNGSADLDRWSKLAKDSPEAEATLTAFRATGATKGDALVMLAQVHGREQALPHLMLNLLEGSDFRSPFGDDYGREIELLRRVGAGDPALARLGFAAWGKDRTFTPDLARFVPSFEGPGFDGKGAIPAREAVYLYNMDWMTALPEGLKVRTNLVVGVPITTLPQRLDVSGDLSLPECDTWDGKVPQGVTVTGVLRTPAHPWGIALSEWRERHPEGETAADIPPKPDLASILGPGWPSSNVKRLPAYTAVKFLP